ncbi:MAG TPA: calcium-binding protein [Solirubrobacteraceae bacterium]|nr:calcium-binding protein [Solirubrobacteraceae bacterium]
MKLAAAPVLLLALLAPAAPAGAATVSVDGSVVTIAAPNRERNQITVTGRSGGGLTIRDARSPVTIGPGCTQTRPDRANCGGAEVGELVADLGALNDSISLGSSAPVRATLRGGSGNDTLRGGQRNDVLAGGTGRDTVTYSGRPGDVTVTLAGGADDGLAGEGDEVLEVERAIGGSGFDVLIGTEGGNTLYGGPGDDRVDGAGGVDTLFGGRGNDLLQGGAGDDTFAADRGPDGSDASQGGDGADRADYSRRTGNVVVDPDGFADDGDRPGATLTFTGAMPTFLLLSSPERDNVLPDVESVRGGAGADVIAPSNAGGAVEGGPGTDVLYGGPGIDSLAGDGGFDRLVARDGRVDNVRCGTEGDRVWLDLDDLADVDCEQRSVSFAPRVVPVARTLGGEGLRVRVECPPQAFVRCQGTLRATSVRRLDRRRPARLGLGSYGLVSGASEEVVIPFDAAARSIVARHAPLRVRVAIRGRDDAGAARPSSARLVLRG